MSGKGLIIGAGGGGGGKGGGGGGRTPVEAPDSLRSRAYAQVLDLLSEGEIGGLVDGAKSIYFNETPLQNADGSYNFQNVTWEARTGTQSQSYVPGFSAVEAETAVATEVKASASVTRTINNTNVNAVRVTISVPQLTKQDTTTGDISGTSVGISIQVQDNGGGYVTKLSDTISGKTTTQYQRSYRVPLTGTGPWDVRVVRGTDDSSNSTLQNKTFWTSYAEIIDAKLRYPNSALVGLRVDSSQFQNIPTRAYDVKLLKVRVPSNYNPTTRVYTGSWDGTFQVAWTDNPAWCFYDLVTSDRYGLGNYIDDSQVDKWSLYSIGRYCDELVPNGFGGTEPRFTCNVYMQTHSEAYKVVQDLASCFRAMAYWASGSLTMAQDAPSDPGAIFNQSNVIDGAFSYSGSSAKARHTVALVTWNDPADFYRQKVEYVEDASGIARFGVITTEVVAVGCTSRGQANRVGRWLLYAERYEAETVTFRTGIEGAVARPGEIIKVADASRAGTRLGGRVSAATTTSVTLDATVSLGSSTWTLFVTLPDGTVGTSVVTGASGAVLSLATALAAAPQKHATWLLTSTSVQAQTFRVLSVVEQTDGTISITALKHNPDKYAAIETGLVLQPRTISVLTAQPDSPSNGQKDEYLYNALTDVKTMVTFSWDAPTNVTGCTYEVSYRLGSGNFVTTQTTGNSVQLSDAQPGDYTVSVTAIGPSFRRSMPYTFIKTVLGKTAPPDDVTGLQMTVQGETGSLQWDSHPDLDVRIGGQISIRYSEQLEGALWNTALPVVDFPGATTSGVVPLRAGTYLAKAKDSSGTYSQHATLVITDAPNIVQFNAVATSTQQPAFTGTKTGMVLVNDRLQLDNAIYFDSIADLDALSGSFDSNLVESGTYEFDTYVDTGAVYTSRVSSTFDIVTYDVENLVDTWPSIDALGSVDEGALSTDYIDNWVNFDGISNFDMPSELDDTLLQVFIATTNDNPASSPTWSDWRVFYLGDYTARAFKFKIIVYRGTRASNQVAVRALGVTVDVPDRVESANGVAVSAAGLSVLYPNAFFATPAVAVTAENMQTGDYAQITAKSPTGFTIAFKNSAGTGVARTMDWIAKGYGYKN